MSRQLAPSRVARKVHSRLSDCAASREEVTAAGAGYSELADMARAAGATEETPLLVVLEPHCADVPVTKADAGRLARKAEWAAVGVRADDVCGGRDLLDPVRLLVWPIGLGEPPE
jgi:hypothetical protein